MTRPLVPLDAPAARRIPDYGINMGAGAPCDVRADRGRRAPALQDLGLHVRAPVPFYAEDRPIRADIERLRPLFARNPLEVIAT